MLVLTRRPQDSITLTGGIVVHILDIRGDVVRIGIDAPKSINIVRTELLPIELGQNVVEYDRTLDCGSLGHVSPDGFGDAVRAAIVVAAIVDEPDAEPVARFMTPMQKLDWATRKPRNHDYED